MPDPLLSLTVALLIIAICVVLFWPERGLYPQWRRGRQLTERVLIEDALKHIHKCELDDRHPTLQSIAGALNIPANQAAELIARLESHNLVCIEAGELCLTPEGRDYALRIIRAHRLWERYLAEETGFKQEDWHLRAEEQEHLLSPAEANALAARLGNPTHDPHGDPIPTSSGELVRHGGQPLTKIPLNQPARIVHIEDEPPLIYEQLLAEGLHVGSEVLVTEITPQRVRFWSNGEEHILAPLLANNISALPINHQPRPQPSGIPLADLRPGRSGKVINISRAIRGAERRRLYDLGLLPGTVVKTEMQNPSGDPIAYRIRGAVIALRRQQAVHIKVEPEEENPNEENHGIKHTSFRSSL